MLATIPPNVIGEWHEVERAPMPPALQMEERRIRTEENSARIAQAEFLLLPEAGAQAAA